MAIKVIDNFNCTNENQPFFDVLSKIIKEKAPFGKVLIIATEKDYLLFGKRVIQVLKQIGNKTINYVVNDEFSVTIKNACGLFCAPEDVRLIISLSDNLTWLKKYFATLRNIPCISISENVCADYFCQRIFIKNNNNLDCIKTKIEDNLIVINNIDKASVYAFTETLKFGLFDFYAKTYFCGEAFDINSVRRAKSLLDLSEKILLNNPQTSVVLQALEFIESVRVNFSKIFEENFINVIFELSRDFDCKKNLSFINYALKLFTDEGYGSSTLKTDDHVDTAEKVYSVWGISEYETLKALNAQKEHISQDKKMQKFMTTLTLTSKFMENSLKNYQTLGGKISSLNSADVIKLKLSGSTPYGTNLMSVLREKFG